MVGWCSMMRSRRSVPRRRSMQMRTASLRSAAARAVTPGHTTRSPLLQDHHSCRRRQQRPGHCRGHRCRCRPGIGRHAFHLNAGKHVADRADDTICEFSIDDIVYTAEVSGIGASFLAHTLNRPPQGPWRLRRRPRDQPETVKRHLDRGQGVGGVNDIIPVTKLRARLQREWSDGVRRLSPPRLDEAARLPMS